MRSRSRGGSATWFRALSRFVCATRAPRPFSTRYGSRALSQDAPRSFASKACITVSRMAWTGASTRLLMRAAPPAPPIPVAQGPGLPPGLAEQLIILPWNDIDALREAVSREGENIAAVLTEPVMCNTGCILPEPGYLEAMRAITAACGILLIYDEVITGFRLNIAGAQGHYGIRPDLSVFAKGLGGGFPVAALGGRKDIMDLVADGTVSMAGTYAANTIAVAAAHAALDELTEPVVYERLNKRCGRLFAGLEREIGRA